MARIHPHREALFLILYYALITDVMINFEFRLLSLLSINACKGSRKKVPTLMAKPLRPYPLPLSLMAIGTLFLSLIFFLNLFP